MRVKVIIVSIILVFFMVIILQNTRPVSLSFLFWDITLPFIVMLLCTLIIGLVSGIVLSSFVSHKKTKSNIKSEPKK